VTGSVDVQQAWQHSTNNVYIKSSQTWVTLSTLPRLGIPTEVTRIPDNTAEYWLQLSTPRCLGASLSQSNLPMGRVLY